MDQKVLSSNLGGCKSSPVADRLAIIKRQKQPEKSVLRHLSATFSLLL
jgi:hypothetical protein